MKLLDPKEANKRGNIATARVIPVLLVGILGYASYVLTDQICIHYLIDPSLETRAQARVSPRVGAAIAILVIYYLLLLVTLACFARLFHCIIASPGLVPRGQQYFIEKARRRGGSGEKPEAERGYTPPALRVPPAEARNALPIFWHKDVFAAQYDGRPPFCSTCYAHKPDRAHHCRELGRCVLKMDHFCPWVGGIVGEPAFKFFVQFTGWAAVLCVHVLIVAAVLLAERQRHGRFINVHWILLVVLAGLFGLFAGGMCGSSLQFCLINSTTIENFTRKTKAWYLCVYVPPRVLARYEHSGRSDLRLITYPRPPAEEMETMRMVGAKVTDKDSVEGSSEGATPPPPPPPALEQQQEPQQQQEAPPPTAGVQRTFAILETQPGENPFDLGHYDNFCEVMGYTPLEWLLPLRRSPLLDHSGPSMYRVGSVVERLRKEVGIVDHNDDDDDNSNENDQQSRQSQQAGEGEREGSRKAQRERDRRRHQLRKSKRRAADGATSRRKETKKQPRADS